MSDKIKNTEEMNKSKEITTEDLDDVAGGKVIPARMAYGFPRFNDNILMEYGGPSPKLIIPKPLTPEEKKKLEREKR